MRLESALESGYSPAMPSVDLLKLLICPESRQALRPADASLVASLNAKIRAGSLQNTSRRAVTELIDSALVREDGKLAYPVRQGIPILLIEEALILE